MGCQSNYLVESHVDLFASVTRQCKLKNQMNFTESLRILKICRYKYENYVKSIIMYSTVGATCIIFFIPYSIVYSLYLKLKEFLKPYRDINNPPSSWFAINLCGNLSENCYS